MRRRRCIGCVLTCVLLSPVNELHAVTYTAQTRTIVARLSAASGSVQSSATAPDFGLWQQEVISPAVPPPASGGTARAYQSSSLAPLSVTINSTFTTSKPTFVGTGYASASSKLTVSFDVTRSTSFRLQGTMPPVQNSSPIAPPAERVVQLNGPGVAINLTGAWTGNTVPPSLTGTGTFDESGVLAPGSYTLNISGLAADGGVYAPWENMSAFNATLAIAAPLGDFDADGEVRAADIDMLLAATTGPVSPANAAYDLNHDGQIITLPNATASDADVWVREIFPTAYGDADLDGRVEFDDLLTLAQNYGQSSGWANGNFDGGTIGFTDLLLVAQNYGFGTSVKASKFSSDWALAVSMVPEPSTLAFALAAFVFPKPRVRHAAN